MNKYLVLDLPIRRQVQSVVRKPPTKWARWKRPKRRHTSLSINVLRKDLVVPMRKKAELSFAEALRRQMERGPLSVVYHDSVSVDRGVKRKSLKGSTATSARRRKRVVDFAAKKTKLNSSQHGGKSHVKPTGTRRQKWVTRQAERIKRTEAYTALMAAVAAGSYNRPAQVELGGYVAKTLFPDVKMGVRPDYDPEMETTIQQAEARGEYNPWDNEEEE